MRLHGGQIARQPGFGPGTVPRSGCERRPQRRLPAVGYASALTLGAERKTVIHMSARGNPSNGRDHLSSARCERGAVRPCNVVTALLFVVHGVIGNAGRISLSRLKMRPKCTDQSSKAHQTSGMRRYADPKRHIS